MDGIIKMEIKNGLIGYMFQDRPKNWLEEIYWKFKGLFGWKNRTGIPIVVSDKVVEDDYILELNNQKGGE